MGKRTAILGVTLALLLLMLGAVANGADHQVGTWKLNIAKSKYSPGPPPKEGMLTIESQVDGLKFTIVGIDAEGKPVHYELSPKYDGKDYPITGNPNADTANLKIIDPRTIQVLGKKNGKVTLTTRSVVSKDGKTRTTTQARKNAKGQDVHNIVVYDRQ
jgi:hypothetical protein